MIATGPFHKYPVTEDGPLAKRLSVAPVQTVPPVVALVNDGVGFTVTIPTDEILESVEIVQVVVHQ